MERARQSAIVDFAGWTSRRFMHKPTPNAGDPPALFRVREMGWRH
jgi:hypothetical protein